MPHISSGPKSKLWSQSSPLTLLGWTVWKIFLSKFGAWTLLIKLLKQIHLCQYPWRRDGGNPNFRAVFVSNAKQYEWSSADVLFHLYLYCLQKLIASKHYWKKGGRHWKEECFSCDFWMQIGNLLSAVNSVFGVLLNMLCYLKVSVFSLCLLPCELWMWGGAWRMAEHIDLLQFAYTAVCRTRCAQLVQS